VYVGVFRPTAGWTGSEAGEEGAIQPGTAACTQPRNKQRVQCEMWASTRRLERDYRSVVPTNEAENPCARRDASVWNRSTAVGPCTANSVFGRTPHMTRGVAAAPTKAALVSFSVNTSNTPEGSQGEHTDTETPQKT
jgi:hypothetical protein